MSESRVELNPDSNAWKNVFRNNPEIREALAVHGRQLAASYSTATDPWEFHVRQLANTQVARVRPKSQALTDGQKKARRKKK